LEQVWPNLGLHHALLAKLQMLLEQPAAARASAERAAEILRVGRVRMAGCTQCGCSSACTCERTRAGLSWERSVAD
jgi:hypothetical protein